MNYVKYYNTTNITFKLIQFSPSLNCMLRFNLREYTNTDLMLLPARMYDGVDEWFAAIFPCISNNNPSCIECFFIVDSIIDGGDGDDVFLLM